MFYLTYSLIICTSFLLFVLVVGVWFWLDGARGLKILMSKKALCLSLFQKLSAFMSNLALSSEFAVQVSQLVMHYGQKTTVVTTECLKR